MELKMSRNYGLCPKQSLDCFHTKLQRQESLHDMKRSAPTSSMFLMCHTGQDFSDKKFLKFLSSSIIYYFTSYQSLVLKGANAHIAHTGKQWLKLRWFWHFAICIQDEHGHHISYLQHNISLWRANKGLTWIPGVWGLSSVLTTTQVGSCKM